jgi:hypothetical protein
MANSLTPKIKRPTPLRDRVVEVVSRHPGELTRNGVLHQLGLQPCAHRNEMFLVMEQLGQIEVRRAKDSPYPKLFPGPTANRRK